MTKIRPVKGNVRLTNTYNNVIKFKNNSEKFQYLDGIETDYSYLLSAQPEVNFNIGDTIRTSVTLDFSNWGDDLNSALGRSYLVAQDSNSQVGNYFYFITNSRPHNNTTVVYDLELDIFTTYGINDNFSVEDFVVERAHINRFKQNDDGTLDFKISQDARVAEDLDSNFNQPIITNEEEVTFTNDNIERISDETKKAKLKEWLEDVDGWIYAFTNGCPTGQATNEYRTGSFTLPYSVFATPINKSIIISVYVEDGGIPVLNKELLTPGTFYSLFSDGDLQTTWETYGISFGRECPIDFYNADGSAFDWYFDEENTLVLAFNYYNALYQRNNGTFGRVFNKATTSQPTLYNVLQIQNNSYLDNYSYMNTNFFKFKTFEKPSKDDLKDIEKELKLLKYPFTKINLKNISSEGKDYDIFDLIEDTGVDCELVLTESISPEGLKSFSTIEGSSESNSRFNVKSRLGNITSEQPSLPVTSSAYAEYVRNNKNSALTGLAIPLVSNVVNTGLGVGLGMATGGVGMAIAGSSVFSSAISSGANVANYFAQIDNLKNTPDTLKNTGNDIIFDNLCDKTRTLKHFIELKELKEKDKEVVFNYFYKYGYRVQSRRSTDELFNRYIFNYIKSSENVTDKIVSTLPMSNKIKESISNALESGVTFWEYSSGHLFDFDYENYESEVIE